MVPSIQNIFRTPLLRSATIAMLLDTPRPTADTPLVVATSVNHQARNCTGIAALKRPACTGAHTIKYWCFKHHAAHKKYLSQL